MKNNLIKIIVVVIMAFVIGCSGNSPKSVAGNFLKAMNKMDFEGAKKYGTEDTGKMLDMLSGFMKMMPDSSKKETHSEIISETIEGDKATVTYKDEKNEGEQVLNLVKIDNQWKVSMNKDNLGGNSDIMDTGATSTDTSEDGSLVDTMNVK